MKIIFAQGNPGPDFTHTRHNVGFFLVGSLAKEFGADFKKADKFSSEIAEAAIDGEKILLVKPQTFYNETGMAARKIIDFYKADPAQDFLVIHDELSLPLGTLRVRQAGSDAGNNGIKSLNAHLGQEYARLRVGVWNDLRENNDATQFVLGRFSRDEQAVIDEAAQHVVDITKQFVRGELQSLTKTTPEAL